MTDKEMIQTFLKMLGMEKPVPANVAPDVEYALLRTEYERIQKILLAHAVATAAVCLAALEHSEEKNKSASRRQEPLSCSLASKEE